MNIYIGNLNYRTTEESIKQLFSQYGEVLSVKLVSDRETGRKRGFGFVEMNDEDGAEAIKNLNEKEVDGRNLRVNEAKEREDNGGQRRSFNRPGYSRR
jgi:RNA recognition motif-containing protein